MNGTFRSASLIWAALLALAATTTHAIDGGILRINTHNGWEAFEVISQFDNPSGDGYSYSVPGVFDGAGAWLPDPATVRVLLNHETSDATISEVDLDLADLQLAITNTIATGNTGAVSFVLSARQAYGRWSDDGGDSFVVTTSTLNTNFQRFCSSQAYAPDTFGPDRGFVDPLYITGEEVDNGRLFVLDSVNRELYQLSGTVGSAPGGIGGMDFDSWENAALIDTGETQHVALLLSPDGDSERMKLYIGEKGRSANGSLSNGFLARNGLAYGSWYYLKASLPLGVGDADDGTFDTSSVGALSSGKLEDVDTSAADPTRAVLGVQTAGVFVFDFELVFAGGFDSGASEFTITKIADDMAGSISGPDNVDWTHATTLGGTSYPDGLIFVNEDNSSGEIWHLNPDGSGKVLIGSTTLTNESTGIFDLSGLIGYLPGSVLITNSQGIPSSMTVLIHPDAEAIPASCGNLICDNGEDSINCAQDCAGPRAGNVTDLLVSIDTGDIRLDWHPSCSVDDNTYAVYMGQVGGQFTSHVIETCDTFGATSAIVSMPSNDHYFIVVAVDDTVEGSYGQDSQGMQRLAANTPCFGQLMELPCP